MLMNLNNKNAGFEEVKDFEESLPQPPPKEGAKRKPHPNPPRKGGLKNCNSRRFR